MVAIKWHLDSGKFVTIIYYEVQKIFLLAILNVVRPGFDTQYAIMHMSEIDHKLVFRVVSL